MMTPTASLLAALFYACLPSFLHVNLRRLFGAKIGKGSRIRFGTLLVAGRLTLEENVSLGPFCVIRAQTVSIGSHSRIKPFSIVSASVIDLGRYVHIAPTAVVYSGATGGSRFQMGDHSRLFPFCWLEPGEGISIGKQVGIGGHGLIFTHGSWPDYLDGGPVSFGPVVIEDNVWLPWRVTVLPGVTLGEGSIIGSGAVVNKSVPPHSLAAGVPAQIVKTNVCLPPSPEEKLDRAARLLATFSKKRSDAGLTANGNRISVDNATGLKSGDLLFCVNRGLANSELAEFMRMGVSVVDHKKKTAFLSSDANYISEFIEFLRTHGIRLYLENRAP